MDNPFWDYSVAVYSREGLPAVCLELQDRCGLDVNVLLYATWLASLGQRLTSSHLLAIESAVEDWRSRVVQPLRALRRELRDYPGAAAIREDIKGIELRSERRQQDLMYEVYLSCGDQPAADRPLEENLGLVIALGCPGEASCSRSIERLCALLGD